MKRILLFILLIMLGAFLKASNIITILKSENFDSVQVLRYTIKYDSIIALEENFMLPEVLPYFSGRTLISEYWNKKEEHYLVSFYTLDSIYRLTFPEIGNRAFSNKTNELALLLTDTEVCCENDLMNIAIIDITKFEETGRISVKDFKIDTRLKNKHLVISYFDEYPRGAGVSPKDILLKVVDCNKKEVFIADYLENLTDLSYEKKKIVFANFNVQWLDNCTFAYMKMKYLYQNTSILYLYSYNVKTRERKLMRSVEFPYSIENIKFQLVKDSLYIMNRNGVFLVSENTIKQLLYGIDFIDFFITP